MSTNMQTVTTSSDYHVAASDHLVFTNETGFQLSQPIVGGQYASPSPHLSISGEVDVIMSSSTAAGADGVDAIVVTNTLNSSPVVTIDPGAVLNVAVTDGSGAALFANGNAATQVYNSGVIDVSANGQAQGLVNWSNGGVLMNNGQLSVTSTTADATGLKIVGANADVVNNGTISVTGHGQVTGVDMGPAGTGESFHNTGTIVAHDDIVDPYHPSIGVHWANGPQPNEVDIFTNDGTIAADRALDVDIGYGAVADNLVTNNGHLIGDVWMGGGAPETLVNNGVIDGSVRLIGPGSVYDGHLGAATGPIVASGGPNTLIGGAGPETMTGGFGNDTISGGGGDDLIDGGDGGNLLDGGSGLNTLSFASLNGVRVDVAAGTAFTANGVGTNFKNFSQVLGSAGSDTISGAAGGADYLRGQDGDDSIVGGAGFDDINGNKGDDTLDGGAGGADWLVGGQGNDLITSHHSDDILYGNLGADTLNGGDGNEVIRGGQQDDLIFGGAGNDWISGDRGNDTETGGAGADIFHSFQDAGRDVVTDFNVAEGDRLMLDPGTTYTVTQVGADTVIDMGAGNEVILQGVQASSLPSGWIFEG